MTEGVRVLLYHSTNDVAGIEAAYHQVSERLAGVPGLLSNELLRSVSEPDGFVVLSRWRGMDEFRAWERGPEHVRQTASLRPFRDTRMSRPFGIYQVMAFH